MFTKIFQFTPLREGRHGFGVGDGFGARISIHAPPRGATRFCETRNEAKRSISIHAPPRGATICMGVCGASTLFQFTPLREGRPVTQSTTSRRSVFQFTPLREGRQTAKEQENMAKKISIHAPPRGATKLHGRTGRTSQFQFTPLREGRRALLAVLLIAAGFQFTPLREGRHAPSKWQQTGIYFNSRPSARGDTT